MNTILKLFKRNNINKEIIIYKMSYYMVISENFTKPYGFYDNLQLAQQEYDKLCKRYINASVYKVELNSNIVDSKECYKLICDNNIHYW